MTIASNVRLSLLQNMMNKLNSAEEKLGSEVYIKKTSKGKFTIRGNLLKFTDINAANIQAIVEEVKEIFTHTFTLSSGTLRRDESAVFKRAMQLGEVCPSLILLKEIGTSNKTINKQLKRIMKIEDRITKNLIRYQGKINKDMLIAVLEIGRHMQRLRVEAAEEIRGFKSLLRKLSKDNSVRALTQSSCPHKQHTKYLTSCVIKWKKVVRITQKLLKSSTR